MENSERVQELMEVVLAGIETGQYTTVSLSDGSRIVLRPLDTRAFCMKCKSVIRPGEPGAVFIRPEGTGKGSMHLSCYYAWEREENGMPPVATEEKTGQTSMDPETGEILTEEQRNEKHVITKVKAGEIPVTDRRLGETFNIVLEVRVVGKGREINKEGLEYPTQKLEIKGINRELI